MNSYYTYNTYNSYNTYNKKEVAKQATSLIYFFYILATQRRIIQR